MLALFGNQAVCSGEVKKHKDCLVDMYVMQC